MDGSERRMTLREKCAPIIRTFRMSELRDID
jgi:hypothetical protein